MPVGTTVYNGCNLAVQVDDATGGTLQTVSTLVATFEFNREIMTETYNAFGQGGTYRIQCKKDTTVTLEALPTPDSEELQAYIEDWWENKGARTLQWDVPSAEVGNRRYSGEFVLLSLGQPFDASSAAPALISCELGINGDLTVETIAS